jgi:gamma-glutamylcyclotransferase (GGCT)/AIG2-like uncharacterized protein YtfP
MMKNTKLMFSYGMNTNSQEMAYRCPKARSMGSAVLADHEFRFATHADVVESPGGVVHGVLWDITEDCLASLDILEGFPVYYQRKIVAVTDQEGNSVDAITYYMTRDKPDSLPSDSYLLMLYEGYAEHDVPAYQMVDAVNYINSYQSAVGTKGSYYYDYQ